MRSLKVSAGITPDFWIGDASILLLLHSLAKSPALGLGQQTRQAAPWLGAGRPQHPKASLGFRVSLPGHPLDPTPSWALTYVWERRGGPRAARAQESQGPEQRQPHSRGAPGRTGAAGAGPRVEEPPPPPPGQTPARHSAATRPRLAPSAAPRGPAPAAQRSLFPAAATGISGVDAAGLAPPRLSAAVRPRLCGPPAS